MVYYIMLPDDTIKDTKYSSNMLGEESFGVFYADQGMIALNRITNKFPERLSEVKIITEHKEELTLTEFFDRLSKFKIRRM